MAQVQLGSPANIAAGAVQVGTTPVQIVAARPGRHKLVITSNANVPMPNAGDFGFDGKTAMVFGGPDITTFGMGGGFLPQMVHWELETEAALWAVVHTGPDGPFPNGIVTYLETYD